MRRRQMLGTLGSSVTGLLCGCTSVVSQPKSTFTLIVTPLERPLHTHWRFDPSGPYADHRRTVAQELIRTVSGTTSGYRLTPLTTDGIRTVGRPRFVEHDGGYYRLELSEIDEVVNTRWIVWFRATERESVPEHERVVPIRTLWNHAVSEDTETESDDLSFTLGARDRDVASMALRSIYPGFLRRVSEFEPDRRGYVYRQFPVEESVFVPDPPFTYLSAETTNRTGEDGTLYFDCVAERASVEEQRYHYRTARVADSDRAYREYVERNVLTGHFSSDVLPDAAMVVVDSLLEEGAPVGGYEHTYREQEPISEGYRTVLSEMGFEDRWDETKPRIVGNRYFRYGGIPYWGVLKIERDGSA